MQAPLKVNELATEWVRFMSTSPPLMLDISLEIKPSASEPNAWKGHVVLEDHQVSTEIECDRLFYPVVFYAFSQHCYAQSSEHL